MKRRTFNIFLFAILVAPAISTKVLGIDKKGEPPVPPTTSLTNQNSLELPKSDTAGLDAVKKFFEHSKYEDFEQHPDTTIFDKHYLAPSS